MSRPDKMVEKAKAVLAEARRLRDECERSTRIALAAHESAERLLTEKLELPPFVRERAKARARRKTYANQTRIAARNRPSAK